MTNESHSADTNKQTSGVTVGDVEGGIRDSIIAGGDFIQNIENFYQRALTAAEEAAQARKLEAQLLAQGVSAFVQGLQALVGETTERDDPFKGLFEYLLSDAEIFFGRDRAIWEFLQILQRDRLTILHSESGVGKTSLLKAGIAPCLLGMGHLAIHLRPYNVNPSVCLKRAFVPDLQQIQQLKGAPLREFLLQVSSVLGEQTRIFVFLDQFEEFFARLDEPAQKAFVSELAECLEDERLNVHWTLVLRTEFFGSLATFRPRINPFRARNDYLLNRLTRVEARDAILKPVGMYNVHFDEKLVEVLLDELGKDDIAPPQLQLVCSTLFDELEPGETTISLALYEQQGKAEAILRGYLERVLSRDLPLAWRPAAHRLLEALVTADGQRARRSQSELVAELARWGVAPETLETIVAQLVDNRLLRAQEDGIGGAELKYELVHDYLLGEIKLDPEVQARKAAQEILEQEVTAWRNNLRLRIPADKLAIIEAQEANLVLNKDAQTLLRLSREVLKRRRRLVFTGTGVVLILIALAVASVVTAVGANRSADTAQRNLGTATVQLGEVQTQKAQVERDVMAAGQRITALNRDANSIALAIQSLTSTDPEQALLYAIRAATAFSEAEQEEVPAQTKRALWKSLASPLWAVLEGHDGEVRCVSFSPDGQYVVTGGGGRDHTARIWDAKTGQEVFVLEGHNDWILSTSFSPDGQYVATGSNDHTARIWSVETGEELFVLEGHGLAVESISFSPDGRYVVTGSYDGTARIWEVETGSSLFVLVGHQGPINSIDISLDGRYVVTGSNDDTAGIWDIKTGQVFILEHGADVWSVSFSPDGRYVVTAGGDGTAHIWDVRTTQEAFVLEGHRDVVRSADFSPDGQYVVTASDDGTARIWEVETGQELFVLAGHSDVVSSVDFSPDGLYVATGSNDHTARIWEVKTGQEVFVLEGHGGEIASVRFSPDGLYVVTASSDGTARVWEAKTGQEAFLLAGHVYWVRNINFSPDGKYVATTGGDGTARIWEVKTGQEVFVLEGYSTDAAGGDSVDFSPDGQYFLMACGHRAVCVWKIPTIGEMVAQAQGRIRPSWRTGLKGN